ncbi:hypothetical protein L208DRAFT_1395638 [Tricholoma matsutake]|nr:hypothetical protein L208DRAFT_1395638 [Tricholoma matsutake 945]
MIRRLQRSSDLLWAVTCWIGSTHFYSALFGFEEWIVHCGVAVFGELAITRKPLLRLRSCSGSSITSIPFVDITFVGLHTKYRDRA